MNKLTKKEYIGNLSSGFKKAGYYRGTVDACESAIIAKNWKYTNFTNNYLCAVSEQKSREFIYRCDGESVHEEYKGKFYRFFHNDICYLLHEYTDISNISIKIVEG